MLVTGDIYTLINYVGFINYLFYGVTVAGQIVLLWKKPDINRPIKVLEPPCGAPSPSSTASQVCDPGQFICMGLTC